MLPTGIKSLLLNTLLFEIFGIASTPTKKLSFVGKTLTNQERIP
jgi:hypothetical protein